MIAFFDKQLLKLTYTDIINLLDAMPVKEFLHFLVLETKLKNAKGEKLACIKRLNWRIAIIVCKNIKVQFCACLKSLFAVGAL